MVRADPKWSKGRPEMEAGPPGNWVRESFFLLISLHFLTFEMGKFYHFNECKKLLQICQHVKLLNYPFNLKEFDPYEFRFDYFWPKFTFFEPFKTNYDPSQGYQKGNFESDCFTFRNWAHQSFCLVYVGCFMRWGCEKIKLDSWV